MRKNNKLQAANLEGDADDVEAAFYEALQESDIDKLMACWADEDEIVCVQPQGSRAVGAPAIRAMFEAIFRGGRIVAFPQQVCKTQSVGSAVHSLLERIEVLSPDGAARGWMVTTNVYHRTPQGWRMVAHHASAGTPPDDFPAAAGPVQVLH